jgi:tetratricopeptide (TPR) repeat protein
LREAARLAPDTAAIHNNLGFALHRAERFPEAVIEYREAIRIQPDLALAHNNLGLSLYALGDTKQAVESYSEAIRLAPSYDEARTNLELATSVLSDSVVATGKGKEQNGLTTGLVSNLSNDKGHIQSVSYPPRGWTFAKVVETLLARKIRRCLSAASD